MLLLLTVPPKLYYVIYGSALADPTAAQIKAGQDATSAAAAASGSEVSPAASTTFNFSAAATGLTASTSYKVALVWSDGSINSNVAVSAAQSTTGGGIALTPLQGSLAFTGPAPVLSQTANQALLPLQGGLTLLGYAPSLLLATNVSAGAGTLTFVGYVPSVAATANQALTPGVGSVALTGYAPNLAQTANQTLSPAQGLITLSGYAPAISQNGSQSLSPNNGVLTLTGYAFALSQTANQSLSPTQGAVVFTGYTPSLLAATLLNPGAGALALTSYAPSVASTANQALLPAAGAVAVTGYTPAVVQAGSLVLAPGVGSLALTGYAPSLVQSSPVNPLAGDGIGFYSPKGKKKLSKKLPELSANEELTALLARVSSEALFPAQASEKGATGKAALSTPALPAGQKLGQIALELAPKPVFIAPLPLPEPAILSEDPAELEAILTYLL